MFRRAHHRDIALILSNLDAELLREHRCYFGGGTAIVLLRDEFRESVDIDFMVSDSSSFRDLRMLAKEGFHKFLRVGATGIKSRHELKVDQYGIRGQLAIAERSIKFEIVHEGRIKFSSPSDTDQICGITTLSEDDLVCSKLLANSDRWADAGVFSRDLIDLAMLTPSLTMLRLAVAKAEDAYGVSVKRDVLAAIERLKTNPAILDRCIQVLDIEVPKALLWKNIVLLTRVT